MTEWLTGGVAEEASEGDDGRETGEVEEEEGGDALDGKTVSIVGNVEGRFSPDVVDQTPEKTTRTHLKLDAIGVDLLSAI